MAPRLALFKPFRPDQVRPKGSNISGFTLIELLIVLAIAGVALAIAAPLFARHATGPTLTAATEELRAALRGARSTAMVEDRAVVFQGDAGGGYWLDRRHFTLPLMSGVQQLRVATEGGPRISFYPSGGSSGGRILVSSGNGQREIAVDALTGRTDALR
ncbi:MAG TPA: GspH/FimT family pseudopilin [Stellaceae bacterium]|nr:GspH/FimT family pseudopilin [Stellaceae bacterium]